MQDTLTSNIKIQDQVTVCFIGGHHSGKSSMASSVLVNCTGPNNFNQRSQVKIQKDYEDYFARPSKEPNEWLKCGFDTLKTEKERNRTLKMKFKYLHGNGYGLNLVDTPSGDYDYHIAKAIAYSDYAVLAVPANIAVEHLSAEDLAHATIAYGLGIRSLIVAITKMDMIKFSDAVYNQICAEVASRLEVIGYSKSSITFLPFSLVCYKTAELKTSPLNWHTGKSLSEIMTNLKVPLRLIDMPFRMMIFEIYKIGGIGTIVLGKVVSGSLLAGRFVGPLDYDCPGETNTIEYAYDNMTYASAGDVVGINIRNLRIPYQNKRMKMISLINPDLVRPVSELVAIIDVLNYPFNLHAGASCRLDANGQSSGCRIKQIINQLDRHSNITLVDPPRLQAGSTYTVILQMLKPVYVEVHDDYGRLGMFVVVESKAVIGYGVVKEITKYHGY